MAIFFMAISPFSLVVTLLDQDKDFRDLHHVLKLSGLARLATVREQ
jgi:hypothetical protein